MIQANSPAKVKISDVKGLQLATKPQQAVLEPVVQLGSAGGVLAVAYSQKADLLAVGSSDGVVYLFRAQDGRLLRTLQGHSSFVRSVAFDPQGKRIASGSADKTVKLWEADSGKLLSTLEGLLGSVESVQFSPSGRYIVAAGIAGRLQFWDTDKEETFLYLYAFGPGSCLSLLPDGRFDGTPDALRYLCYTERGTFNSFTAEELLEEFHDPKAVKDVLAKYHTPPQPSLSGRILLSPPPPSLGNR